MLESARRDLNEGCEFYESQESGLGDYFLTSERAVGGGRSPLALVSSSRAAKNVNSRQVS